MTSATGRFQDKTVIATGVASGLGRATVKLFAAEGASLVLVDRDGDRLDVVAQELDAMGARTVQVVGDVSQAATADEAVRAAEQRFGRVDVLFNNAGIDPLDARSLVDTTEELWDRTMGVNVKAAFLFARAVIPPMQRTGGGSIVSTASSAGIKASPQEAVYGISKAALIALTRSLARDFTSQGIRANCICPGFLECVMTDRRQEMTEDALVKRSARAGDLVPMGREGQYDEVAHSVLFLAGPESSYTSGAALVIDGGWIA
jgi:NAD(P)-dependent dehydrogenase (short-subunit alcohol dehydrogenase family)